MIAQARRKLSVILLLGACAAQPAKPHAPLLTAAGDVIFVGMCDASGAVPLTAHTFAVADDEDNVLRVYDADRGGAALYQRDISAGIGIPARARKLGHALAKPPAEADIEAATRMGELALWLTSHARNSKGKLKPERLRFFATTLPAAGSDLRVVGRPYSGLIDDLSADPRYAAFGLQAAAAQAPKTSGGLNIEGMTARAQGDVMIGLRAPTPGGRALLFVLSNPKQVLEGARPEFGEPILLDLAGLGVRALSRWHDQYLIAAGNWGSNKTSRLYTWDGTAARPQPLSIDFQNFNPEGFYTPEARDQIMLLSDDGSEPNGTERCKDQEDPTRKHFRGRWLQLPSSP